MPNIILYLTLGGGVLNIILMPRLGHFVDLTPSKAFIYAYALTLSRVLIILATISFNSWINHTVTIIALSFATLLGSIGGGMGSLYLYRQGLIISNSRLVGIISMVISWTGDLIVWLPAAVILLLTDSIGHNHITASYLCVMIVCILCSTFIFKKGRQKIS